MQDVAGELVGGGCEGGVVDDVHLLVDFALEGQVVLGEEAQFGLFAGVGGAFVDEDGEEIRD